VPVDELDDVHRKAGQARRTVAPALLALSKRQINRTYRYGYPQRPSAGNDIMALSA